MRIILLTFLLVPFQALATPKLFFSWANPYDKMCARGFDFSKTGENPDSDKLKESWSIELKNRVTEFQERWDKDSQVLFQVLLIEFKKDFARTEYSASLSACAVAPSMPDPLVLNVSRYLKAFWAPKEPKDMKYFVDTPFHELLHLWLSENLSKDTPIATKYKNEKFGVVSHIHLFAMQSLIYEKAGMGDNWKEVHAFILRHGGVHQRALELMEKEGRDKVLKELK